jgi:hypothetical protein
MKVASGQVLEWQQAYREALVESDPPKLREKIAEAEALILFRLRSSAQGTESAVERRAMNAALCHLRLFSDEQPE